METIRKFLSSIFYRLASLISRTFFFGKIKFIKGYETRKREEIEKYQLDSLKKLISVAYENSPFYRRIYEEAALNPDSLKSLSDLAIFPYVSKEDIKEEYRSMVNSDYKPRDLKVTTSSGSTGTPKSFYYDRSTYGWRMASMYIGWLRGGFQFGDKWMRISNGKRDSLFYKFWNSLSRCIYINSENLNEESLERMAHKMREERPTLIYSYAISMYLLADHLDKKGERIEFVGTIITIGSILFPHYREVIERVFGIKVTDTYGGDAIVVSGQCEKGNYHIQDTGVIFEVVDEKYEPLPVGERGRVLITDLHNYAMPMIRYEIGDLGIKKDGGCSCGNNFSLMEQPIGRDTDIIKLSNGTIFIVHYFGVMFRKYEEVLGFQVREVDQDFLRILLVVDDKFTDNTRDAIIDKVVSYAKGGVKVEIELVDEIPILNTNKRRYMIAKDN